MKMFTDHNGFILSTINKYNKPKEETFQTAMVTLYIQNNSDSFVMYVMSTETIERSRTFTRRFITFLNFFKNNLQH